MLIRFLAKVSIRFSIKFAASSPICFDDAIRVLVKLWIRWVSERLLGLAVVLGRIFMGGDQCPGLISMNFIGRFWSFLMSREREVWRFKHSSLFSS